MKSLFKAVTLSAALMLAGCSEKELYRNLSQQEANELVAALNAAGIQAEREVAEGDLYKVLVPGSSLPQAAATATALGLPANQYKSVDDLFPTGKLVMSPAETRARLAYATSQELGRSISSLDGVLLARVHVVTPDQDLRGQPIGKPSASALIKHRAGADQVLLTAQAKAIIGKALAGLANEDVAVVLVEAQPLASLGQGAAQAPSAFDSSPERIGSGMLFAACAAGLAFSALRLRRSDKDAKI
ncbi:type III secretion system inner membrane ring lipoprotein SctJ [Alsobacter soli]|nr:type III secretion inner membrane ring lipoprotein SctJ [Alsobacter soli]